MDDLRLRRSSAPDRPARPPPTRPASSGATVAIDRPAVVRRELPAHRLPALEVAARRGGPPRREPGDDIAGRTPRRRATTWSTGRRMPPSPTIRATCARLREAGAVAYRGTATITGQGRVAVSHDDATPRAGRRERRRRGRVGLEASADRGPRRDPGLDEPRGDARPRAAGEPARARRRPDGLRARPGRTPGSACRRRSSSRARAWPRPTIRATRRSCARRSSATASIVRTGVRALRARAGCRARTAHTSSSWTTARRPRATRSCSPSAGRSRSTTSGSSTTASTRAVARRSRATAGCASPTGCGSSATRPDPSSTPTRATTRASSRSGWRWASRCDPTTGPCRARRTRIPRRRRSG